MHKPPRLLARKRFWMLPILLVALVAGHGAIAYYVSSHVKVSAAVATGAMILFVLHAGFVRGLVLFRRRRARNRT